MYKMLDWEGWSFWRFEYDIYEGEGAKVHITNNLMNGFISRAEHTNKYTCACVCVHNYTRMCTDVYICVYI